MNDGPLGMMFLLQSLTGPEPCFHYRDGFAVPLKSESNFPPSPGKHFDFVSYAFDANMI